MSEKKVWKQRFQSKRKLADTLQGHIYLALDLQHGNRKVVVKETYKTLVETGKSRDGHVVHEDFHNETRILTYLSKQPDADDGFCRIIYEWETEDCYYYAMQWCEAELFKFISNSFANNGTMFKYMQKETNKQQIPCDTNNAHQWLSKIQQVFRQCVQCVYWMQQKGVCHLDLSLENTMIYKVDGLKVKIIDFGLAKHYDYKNDDKDALFQNDTRVGKRGYMAPEVYNKMIYDARRADVWSLGVMLFMMLVGAPPYKRATQRDAAFNYIINGMLQDVLKHWRRLRLISKDALDCMEKIFKWEKDRIGMEQLITHPFVGLQHLLKQETEDFNNSYHRIIAAIKEYHNNYVLPMQAQHNKGDDIKETEDDGMQLISFKTDALGKSDKLVLPTFVTACKDILHNGNVRLMDDFNHILSYHATLHNNDDDNNEQSLSQLFDGLLDEIKNKSFVRMDNSIIIRRCFRNRIKCEDEKSLLEVYGKYNKNVINDEQHRMAMQIMDKIYCYFAYSYNFGYSFDDDEVKQLDAIQEEDAKLFKVKQLLKRKKQEMLKSNYGKQIYNVIGDRKMKYCTSSNNHFSDECCKSKSVPGASISIFKNIKNKMQQYLLFMKSAPPTMSSKEFVAFLKTLQYRSKKEERFASLKQLPSDQWKALINKFSSTQISEKYFLGLSKKQFGRTLKNLMHTGYIVKLHKVLADELRAKNKQRFFTTKDRVELCDNKEIIQLLETVLKETDKIDIANDLNIDKLREIFAAKNMNGAKFMSLDEEYIITNYICKCLSNKFDDIDAHRFGKRFRYWPAYSENKSNDLLNGFYTHHWYVRPKFNDIKDEILNNEICCITVNQWNRTVLYASKVIIRTVAIKQLKAVVPINKKDGGSTSNSSYNKYGVKNNDRIRLEHLVPLLIYINLDFVSKQLLATYNNSKYMNNEYQEWIKYMKHHSQLSHLARLIRETMECYGKSYTDAKPLTFYHLVDKSIPVSSLNVRFFSPTSVTTSLNAAFVLNDFNDDEVILQLDCYTKSSLKYFNASWLSDYPNEHEHIICGGLGCLSIINIYDLCLSCNYEYHIAAIYMLINTVKGDPIPNHNKEENQQIAVALNALMQNKYNNKESQDASYLDKMFNEICNNTNYIQMNMNDVIQSELMKFVLCNKKGAIRFDVLGNIFSNISRFYVSLENVDKETQTSIIFNDHLIKCLAKINEERISSVLSIKFDGVHSGISSSDTFKTYQPKCNQIGWKINCFTFDKITTLSLDYNLTVNND